MSATLSSPGQCLQSCFLLSCKISFTLCRTNCFHSPWFCIQHSAVLLSSQYVVLLISRCNFRALLTVCTSLANKVADINSSLGIVNFLSGATLDLLAISFAYISFSDTKYRLQMSTLYCWRLRGHATDILIRHHSGFCTDVDQSR